MPASLHYDHYKVLGIERDAPAARIKQAYRARVKQCHPDRDPSPGAHLRFLVVHQAYTVLSDPEQRSRYDERLTFYRPAKSAKPASTYRRAARCDDPTETEDRFVPHFAFIGLHLTGLVFGICLVSGILLGVLFDGWPGYALFFIVPGLAVIPDSIQGLRTRRKRRT
jgi:curved DNA-binding protein CbpA